MYDGINPFGTHLKRNVYFIGVGQTHGIISLVETAHKKASAPFLVTRKTQKKMKKGERETQISDLG